MKCFMDLDDVLIDFVGGAHKFHELPYEYECYPYPLGEWDFIKYAIKDAGLTEADFWGKLGYQFWRNLDWMPDGRSILSLAEQTYGAENVCILTSPCLTDGCTEGKLAWVKKNLPAYSRRVLVGACKEFCASSDAWLWDDADKNVNKFVKAGGHGILIPRPWNSRFAEVRCCQQAF